MALTMRDTYFQHHRPACIVTFPEGHQHAGTWRGEIRARLVDEHSDWWFEVQWRDHTFGAHIAAVPVTWCRRPELTDDDALVSPATSTEHANPIDDDSHADCPRCTCRHAGGHCKHEHDTWGPG